MPRKRSWLRVPVASMLCAASMLVTAAASAPMRVEGPRSNLAGAADATSAGRLIVQFVPGTTRATAAAVEGVAGARLLKEIPDLAVRVVAVRHGGEKEALAALRR